MRVHKERCQLEWYAYVSLNNLITRAAKGVDAKRHSFRDLTRE